MPRDVTQMAGWTAPGDEEEDDRSLGPEDYAWFAQNHPGFGPGWVPNLEWVWDRGPGELVAHLIAVAVLQPTGSA